MVCRSLWRPWLAKPSLWKWNPQTLLKMWRPRFRIKKAFPRPAASYLCWQAAGGWLHSVWLQHPEGVHSPLGAASPWWLLTFVCFSFMWTHFFPTLTISVLYFNQNCSKWFLPHNVYAYFLCGLMCTWIHESDAELICMRFFVFCFCFFGVFFSDVLTYCVMLQAFICYCSFVRCFWRARARVCICCSLALYSAIEHV